MEAGAVIGSTSAGACWAICLKAFVNSFVKDFPMLLFCRRLKVEYITQPRITMPVTAIALIMAFLLLARTVV